MAKKKKAAKKAAKAPKEPLIVASKVKAYIKSAGMMSSKEFLAAANEALCEILDKAIRRAQENKRSTLQPRDL